MRAELDELDARIVTLFSQRPSIGVLGASRELGVARGTVQTRLDRLHERGVIASSAPTISAAALGFPVTAYCHLQVRQRGARLPLAAHLSAIPEVLEAHTITGDFDIMVVAVARDHDDLQRVIDRIVGHEFIERASTQILLHTHVPRRTLPLVHLAAAPSDDA